MRLEKAAFVIYLVVLCTGPLFFGGVGYYAYTFITRVENGVEKIIEVRVDAITDAGKKIQDVLIQPNDIIFVPESFF